MVKVFIMLLWATGGGAEVEPRVFPTFDACWQAGEEHVALDAGYDSFVCNGLEIGDAND